MRVDREKKLSRFYTCERIKVVQKRRIDTFVLKSDEDRAKVRRLIYSMDNV